MGQKHQLTSHSISRNMVVAFLIMTVCASGLSMYIGFVITKHRIESDLKIKSQEIIRSLIDVINVPLWNYDIEAVESIGESYLQNIFIASLKIQSNDGLVIFEKAGPEPRNGITVMRDIIYKSKKIGIATISMTAFHYVNIQHHIFWTYGVIFSVMMVILFFGNILILRLLLQKPLRQFTRVVKGYTSGDTEAFKQAVPYKELQPYILVLRDMGDQITSQIKRMIESENRYRTLVEQIPAATYTSALNQNRSILFISPQITDISGYAPGEWQQDDDMWFHRLHPDDLNRIKDKIEISQQSDISFAAEYRLIHRDQHVVWVRDQNVIIKDEMGNALFRQGLIADITDVKKVEKEKKQLEIQLVQAQKMEAIGTLAGGIAHDFNNILAVIIGYSELLLDLVEQKSEVHFFINDILQAGNRAKNLTKQILTFSRQSTPEKIPLQIKSTLKEVLSFLKASLPTTINIQENLQNNIMVLADPTQIHQVVMNLCTNAAHAMMKKKGTLTISLSKKTIDTGSTINGQGLKPGLYCQLTVNDTGHGMPENIIDKIFHPFFSTKEKGEGTGMGLSVVHGIIKSHGGSIDVSSKQGIGTTFTILLPAITGNAAAPDIEYSTQLPTGNERIMVVDDEPAIADINMRTLESLGYKVSVKTSSINALTDFSQNPNDYDLIISDMTMPGMTGVELSTEIFSIRPNMPIILCSGFSSKTDQENTEMAGIRAFIYKPILKQDLAETVRHVLDGGDIYDG